MNKFKIEATKFTIVGAANFVLTFVVFTSMLKMFEVNYLLSLVAAWVVGMLFSYVLNFSWVFKPEEKIQFKTQFVKFFLASVLSITLNMLFLRYIVEYAGFDPFYAQMVLIPVIVVFNFVTAKYWSLRPTRLSTINNQQQANPYKYYIDFIFVTILGLMLFCTLATIFWGAGRCLGLSDEGIYLLAARYPDEIQQNVSSVYIYTSYLFRMVGFNPIGFRFLGVVLVCSSALVFWFGFYKFLFEFCPKTKAIKYFRLYSLFFIELGVLLHYQWFYMTPNYNTLISLSISISAGSILWGGAQLDNWEKNIKSIVIAFTVVGIAVGLALFTKFPAGFCLLFLYLGVIFLWCGIKRNKKIILLISVLVGVAFWFFLHFFFVQPPQVWWQMFKEGWVLFQAFGVRTPELKSIVYIKELLFFVYSAIKIYWPCYLIICGIYLLFLLKGCNKKLSEKTIFIMIFIVLLSAVILSIRASVMFLDERKTTDGSIPFYLVFHFAWILLLLTVCIINSCKSENFSAFSKYINMNILIVLGLLVTLPIAGSVGTANPIYNVPLCHAVTWFAAILFMFVFLEISEQSNFWLRVFTVFFIGAFSVSQIIQGYIFDPQGITTNLLQQVITTDVGFPIKKLKLDQETHDLVNELSSIASINGFQPGGDIIAMSNRAGLVYAMGGKSPGHVAFLAPRESFKGAGEYSRLALQYADIKRLRNAFVLLNVAPETVEILLKNRGLNFPGGYKLVGTVILPRGEGYTLWKPINIIKN